jgi:dTDP-4-dehydrorhamnose 3,5-epimerase
LLGTIAMKLLKVETLAIPDIRVIRFARFRDQRGYFTEHFRKSDLQTQTPFLAGVEFYQANESYSMPGTVRGLHFQWNPYMGKLVRTLHGRMLDLVLDIRKGSPSFGKIIAYDMPARLTNDWNEWIWVPPGFAHGNVFPEESAIEYFCSGEYSPGCEAGISPLAADIDWSLCDPGLRDCFQHVAHGSALMTEKDRNGFTVAGWRADPRSDNFVYGQV